MPAPPTEDLASLDRDVARAHAAWESWTRAVTLDPEKHAGDEEPLERWRHVTAQSTFDALAKLSPSAVDGPLREGLRRWVFALLQARVGAPLVAEAAREASAKTAHAALPVPHLTSWREAWRALVASPTVAERRAWLDAACERGPAMAAVARRRAERRLEAARRLGLEHADALFAWPRASVDAAAEALLARTDDLAHAVLREARAKQELAVDPPLAVDAWAVAVARDAGEGWPARLQWRWLESTFGLFTRGLRVSPPPLPEALGAASFARACAAFGAQLRVAGASPSLPFTLARDPWFVPRHRFAFVFGALPASRAFQRRALGNVARVAANQARVLARTALVEARLVAVRWLLGREDRFAARDAFESMTARVLGAPLPPALCGAWPMAQGDEAARVVGLVTAPSLARDLVDRFDEDWFANPRAVQVVRALASGPAHEGPEPADATDLGPHVDALARAFVEALG